MKTLYAMKYSTISRAIASAFLLFAMVSTQAAEVKLYKWIDADGKISYQDKPPPEGQKFEEKSFTDQGANTERNSDVDRSEAARENPVTLYVVKDSCDSCDLVRTILDLNQIPYKQIDIEADEDALKNLIKLAGSARVPTITIGDKVVTGFDRNGIEDTLKESGYPVAKQVME